MEDKLKETEIENKKLTDLIDGLKNLSNNKFDLNIDILNKLLLLENNFEDDIKLKSSTNSTNTSVNIKF